MHYFCYMINNQNINKMKTTIILAFSVLLIGLASCENEEVYYNDIIVGSYYVDGDTATTVEITREFFIVNNHGLTSSRAYTYTDSTLSLFTQSDVTIFDVNIIHADTILLTHYYDSTTPIKIKLVRL